MRNRGMTYPQRVRAATFRIFIELAPRTFLTMSLVLSGAERVRRSQSDSFSSDLKREICPVNETRYTMPLSAVFELYLRSGPADLAQTLKVLSYLHYGHARLHELPYHHLQKKLQSIL